MNRPWSIGAFFAAYALMFTAILGADSPSVILSADGYAEQPYEGSSTEPLQYGAGSHATLAWRGLLGPGGFFSLTAQLSAMAEQFSVFQDDEYMRLKASLPLSDNTISGEAGLHSSAFGYRDFMPFIQPDWNLSFSKTFNNSRSYWDVLYRGSYLYIPSSVDDVLHQGAALSIRSDPSIRLGYGGTLELGFEYQPEVLLYGPDGVSTSTRRQDLVITGGAEIDGLAGYFLSWGVNTRADLRLSNAPLYLVSGTFLERSEDAWEVSINGNVHWSPHQSLSIQFSAGTGYMRYLFRPVILENGTVIDQRLSAYSASGKADVSWTPNHLIYIRVGMDVQYIYYHSQIPSGMLLGIHGGIDFSF